MADDILGHENLDHGKHLKHQAHKPSPGERFGRGSKPHHVGLGRTKYVHDHSGHDHAHLHANEHHHAAPTRTYWWLGASVLGIILFLVVYRAYPAFAALIIILTANTLIEFHKMFTEGVPVDIEILFIGSAYLTAVHGIGWGLVAVLGPYIADGARGHIHESTTVKAAAVLVTVATAAILGATAAEFVFAILLGNVTQYLILFAMGRTSGVMSVIRRLTTFGFNSYLALFALPFIIL